MMKYLLVLSLFLIQHLCWASDLVAVAERDTPGGLEQVALSLSEAQATLTLNSNFLALHEKTTKLGKFAASGKPLRGYRQELEQIFLRLNRAASIEKSLHDSSKFGREKVLSPHSIKLYLGGQRVELRSAAGKELLRILSDPWRLAAWQSVGSAEVTLAPAGKVHAVHLKGSAALATSCHRYAEVGLRCQVEKFGYVYLFL